MPGAASTGSQSGRPLVERARALPAAGERGDQERDAEPHREEVAAEAAQQEEPRRQAAEQIRRAPPSEPGRVAPVIETENQEQDPEHAPW